MLRMRTHRHWRQADASADIRDCDGCDMFDSLSFERPIGQSNGYWRKPPPATGTLAC